MIVRDSSVTDKILNSSAILWDCDGVIYDYEEVPNRSAAKNFLESMAVAAQEVFPELTRGKAMQIGMKSFSEYSTMTEGFDDYARDRCESPTEKVKEIFDLMHKYAFKNITSDYPDLFTLNKSYNKELCDIEGVKHAIVTHSSGEYWAKPIIKALDLEEVFPAENIFGLEDSEFEVKSDSAKLFLVAMQSLEIDPSEVIFIDDSAENIRFAKATFPEMTVIYKSKAYPETIIDGADAVVEDRYDFVKSLSDIKQAPKVKAVNAPATQLKFSI